MTSFSLFELQRDDDMKKRHSNLNTKQRLPSLLSKVDTSTSAENEELFVFGYSCKLFRDDTVALKQENEAGLIPWNGDPNLLIDRYDCRGYLFDLAPHDADLLSKQKNFDSINEEDIEIEELCDKERYMDLNKQLKSEALYQEEELKRFYAEQQEYGAVQFTYTTPENSDKNNMIDKYIVSNESLNEIEAFVPSEKLSLPIGMLIPETKKQNAIIEKTANFVASAGLQMEILIKAKQSTNSQFNFLNYEHHLNSYYKHLVTLIKNGNYVPEINDVQSEEESESDNETYLHPLLSKNFKSSKDEDEKKAMKFKPNIKDTPYNELIEKFTFYSSKLQSSTNESSTSCVNAQASIDNTSLINKAIMKSETIKESIIPIIPSPDLKAVIDKLADYVYRNGTEFEKCITEKNDPRFSFLKPEDSYYGYYQQTLMQIKILKGASLITSQHIAELNPESKDKNLLGESSLTNMSKTIAKDKSEPLKSEKEVNDIVSHNDILEELNQNDERLKKEKQAIRKQQASLFLKNIGQTQFDDQSLVKQTSNIEIKTSENFEKIQMALAKNYQALTEENIFSKSKSAIEILSSDKLHYNSPSKTRYSKSRSDSNSSTNKSYYHKRRYSVESNSSISKGHKHSRKLSRSKRRKKSSSISKSHSSRHHKTYKDHYTSQRRSRSRSRHKKKNRSRNRNKKSRKRSKSKRSSVCSNSSSANEKSKKRSKKTNDKIFKFNKD